MLNETITAIKGIQVGHYTDLDNATGCSVILCKNGAVGGVDVRGGSPGTRETDVLRPMHRIDKVHSVVLSGGSAFGLDAASGVVKHLESQNIGVAAGNSIVPIVSSAILFDLGVGSKEIRPDSNNGWQASELATSSPVEQGTVGAGTGATVGKALGIQNSMKGGIGSAVLTLPSGITVASLIAVNSWGGVVDYRSNEVLAGPLSGVPQRIVDTLDILLEGVSNSPEEAGLNTTIGVIATDASLTKEEVNFLAQVSHDGLALAIRPCHTIRDGDTMFGMATCERVDSVNMTAMGAAAVEVTAQAVVNAVNAATGLAGILSVSDLAR
ncbi:MAG: P1 family peptidase [Chloroflexota bacterium]|nr:P1 family peptidase [Chloroflexota bacterium]